MRSCSAQSYRHRKPFTDQIEFQLINEKVPCDPDFSHFTRVYGMGGDQSKGILTTVIFHQPLISPAIASHKHLTVRHTGRRSTDLTP